jgi:hypothetical protein
MFEAKLSDPVHGKATCQAETAEAAVETAFRQLADSWMHPNDKASWSADDPMFDGEIETLTDDVDEIWWNGVLLGTVRQIS